MTLSSRWTCVLCVGLAAMGGCASLPVAAYLPTAGCYERHLFLDGGLVRELQFEAFRDSSGAAFVGLHQLPWRTQRERLSDTEVGIGAPVRNVVVFRVT